MFRLLEQRAPQQGDVSHLAGFDLLWSKNTADLYQLADDLWPGLLVCPATD